MEQEGFETAEVNEVVGSVIQTHEGYANSKLVGFRENGNDYVWPIPQVSRRPLVRLQGKRFRRAEARRVYLVSKEFPEFAMPLDTLVQVLVEWRAKATKASLKVEPDPEDPTRSRTVIDKEKFAEHLAQYGSDLSEAERTMLAQVFSAGMTAEDTGQIAEGTWIREVLAKIRDNWQLAIGAYAVGGLQGWQLADQALPNIADSWWFALLLPVVIIVLFVVMSKKGA